MKKGYIFIAFSTLFFSTMEIALKLVATEFNPMQLNFLRFLIGSLILAPLALRHLKGSGLVLSRKIIGYFLLSGFVCVVVSMTFFQMAVVYAHASTVAILFSCNAAFLIPFAHFFLHEKLSRLSLLSLVISLVGMICIINPTNLTNPLGISLALIGAVTFALYGIIGRKGSLKFGFDGVVQSSFSFLAGSLELLVLILISKIPAMSAWLQTAGFPSFSDIPVLVGISWKTLPMLIYLGVMVTGLGFCFYFLAMEETSASTASLVFFIKPALAPVLALLILGEVITVNMFAGMALIIAGSCVQLLADKLENRHMKQLITKKRSAFSLSAHHTHAHTR